MVCLHDILGSILQYFIYYGGDQILPHQATLPDLGVVLLMITISPSGLFGGYKTVGIVEGRGVKPPPGQGTTDTVMCLLGPGDICVPVASMKP